jgi:hypothetical protein
MHHLRVYNEAITADIKQALWNRDTEFFRKEIIRLATVVANDPSYELSNDKYNPVTARLQVVLALHDQLKRRGETLKLLFDLVNF